MPATITKPTATVPHVAPKVEQSSTKAPSKAEQVAITPVAKGNAAVLLSRLKKFSEEFMYRRNSDLSFNDMRRAGYLSEDLTTRETGEAVAILARAYAEAIDEMLPGIKK